MITHEQISKRAREIWEEWGRPEGYDNEIWAWAEEELKGKRDVKKIVQEYLERIGKKT